MELPVTRTAARGNEEKERSWIMNEREWTDHCSKRCEKKEKKGKRRGKRRWTRQDGKEGVVRGGRRFFSDRKMYGGGDAFALGCACACTCAWPCSCSRSYSHTSPQLCRIRGSQGKQARSEEAEDQHKGKNTWSHKYLKSSHSLLHNPTSMAWSSPTPAVPPEEIPTTRRQHKETSQ